MQEGDWIAQLIFERIETPHAKRVAALDDTKHGVGGFGGSGVMPFIQSPHLKKKEGKKKESNIPITRFRIGESAKLD